MTDRVFLRLEQVTTLDPLPKSFGFQSQAAVRCNFDLASGFMKRFVLSVHKGMEGAPGAMYFESFQLMSY
jgi:hypothetical protein